MQKVKRKMHAFRSYPDSMKDELRKQQGSRIAEARRRRGMSQKDAYTALGIPKTSYEQYENGTRGISQVAERLARFYRIDLTWLLTGKGAMDGKRAGGEIPVHGVVGAGSTILPIEDDTVAIALGDIQLPDLDSIGAVIVKGDSGYPRYQDGEIILFYTRQLTPQQVCNKAAIVQTWDGRRMIKTIRPGREPGKYTLESFNAPPEHDVEIMCGWAIHSLIFRH